MKDMVVTNPRMVRSEDNNNFDSTLKTDKDRREQTMNMSDEKTTTTLKAL